MNARPRAVGLLIGATVVATACSELTESPTSQRTTMTAALDQASIASVVTDPAGDAAWNLNTGPGSAAKAPDYLDIVRAEVSKTAGRFVFTLDLAAPVPNDPSSDPSLPSNLDHIGWEYGIDADTTTFPVGYPFEPGSANLAEFYLGVNWNPTGSFGLGMGFDAFVIDRRPLLQGGDAVTTPVDFSIEGTRLTIVVKATLIGDPTTFRWIAFSHYCKEAHPKCKVVLLDVAPSDFNLVLWP